MKQPPPGRPPVKRCPDCGKRMSAFWQDGKWKHRCRDEPKHAQAKLKAQQQSGLTGKGGVRKGTPSPMRGKMRNKKYVTRIDWTKKRRKPKDEK